LISKRFGWFFILFIVKKHRWTGILGQTNTRTNRLSISTWLSVRTLCFTVWCCLLSYCLAILPTQTPMSSASLQHGKGNNHFRSLHAGTALRALGVAHILASRQQESI
jgi:hypothetical protein